MAERTASDDAVAAVLRRAVGDPTGDLGSVLARGRRARRTRARRSFVITAVAGLAAMIALVTFLALRSQPTTPQPAGVPRHAPSAIAPGTYATRPLTNAALIRDGFGPAGLTGRTTVFTLEFGNGTYRELQAVDGGPPQVEDAGTYEVVGSTVMLSNNIGQGTVLTVRRTHDGFIVDAAHFDCECQNERRIARVLDTTGAAFHPVRTH